MQKSESVTIEDVVALECGQMKFIRGSIVNELFEKNFKGVLEVKDVSLLRCYKGGWEKIRQPRQEQKEFIKQGRVYAESIFQDLRDQALLRGYSSRERHLQTAMSKSMQVVRDEVKEYLRKLECLERTLEILHQQIDNPEYQYQVKSNTWEHGGKE